jgi:predicted GNAT family acetyltransferase
MANIHIEKDEDRISRSELEERLRGEGWGRSMTDAQLDKCKYLERKLKEEVGLDRGKLHDDFLRKVGDGL